MRILNLTLTDHGTCTQHLNINWNVKYSTRNFCMQLRVCKCEKQEWCGLVKVTQPPQIKLVLKGLNTRCTWVSTDTCRSSLHSGFCCVKRHLCSAPQCFHMCIDNLQAHYISMPGALPKSGVFHKVRHPCAMCS